MYAGQVVESGPAGPVVDRPAHPYTDLLIGSVPDPRRAAVPVKRARAGAAATGCPFAARSPWTAAAPRNPAPPRSRTAAGAAATGPPTSTQCPRR
ncbi:hypothetical protein ACFVWY_32755 [Streptomyces sp. NPDC058195]|uniref:ABC transporter ATP-binding protein n=1 Tax=Streptomyces sp. NPDC058195 TaxID=3346375 RepID=UPI0036E7DD23